jgi:hypothetical protein
MGRGWIVEQSETIRVRGYGFSIGFNPSPALAVLGRPLPMGEVKKSGSPLVL